MGSLNPEPDTGSDTRLGSSFTLLWAKHIETVLCGGFPKSRVPGVV